MTLTTDSACTEAEALARFKADTAEHVLTVLHDDGLYRHLRVAKPGTGFYHFDLITWPGCLTITGDMGTWSFRRTEDMFEFFRSSSREHINPHYWGEKLLGGDDSGRTLMQAYSEDEYRRHVQDALDDWIESYYENEAQATSLRAAVLEELLDRDAYDYPGNHHQSATEAIRNFQHRMVPVGTPYYFEAAKVLDRVPFATGLAPAREQVFTFEDSWEWDLTGYSLFFLWACYAIQDGIHRYDLHKNPPGPCPGCGAEYKRTEDGKGYASPCFPAPTSRWCATEHVHYPLNPEGKRPVETAVLAGDAL